MSKTKRAILYSIFFIILAATIGIYIYEEVTFVPVDNSGHALLALGVLRVLAFIMVAHEINILLCINYIFNTRLEGSKTKNVFNIILLILGIISLIDLFLSNGDIMAVSSILIILLRIIYGFILMF